MLLAIDEVDNEDNSKRGQDDEDSSTPILIFGAVGRPDDMVLPGARRVRRVPTSDGLRDLRLQLNDLRLGWGTASATCPRFRRASGIKKLIRQAEEHHRKSHDACRQAVHADGRGEAAPTTFTSSPKCSGANKCPRLPNEDSREILRRT